MLFNELHTSNSLDLRQLDELMAAGRVRNMGQLVHRLKGAARMVGAQVLSDAALVYEEGLAQSVADEEISARAGNVRAAVQQLQEAVASWMAAAD
ncbi:Hpt domain protein [compost metagenome]